MARCQLKDLKYLLNSFLSEPEKVLWDQYQYLGNCPPTPPLTQH